MDELIPAAHVALVAAATLKAVRDWCDEQRATAKECATLLANVPDAQGRFLAIAETFGMVIEHIDEMCREVR